MTDFIHRNSKISLHVVDKCIPPCSLTKPISSTADTYEEH